MATSKSLLHDIRKDLQKALPNDPVPSARQIVEELAPDIYDQVKQGARLKDVYRLIRAKLPERMQLTEATFLRYWREARDAADLPKIRNSGRKKTTKTPPHIKANAPQIIPQNTSRPTRPLSAKATSNDFRDDPEDI